MPPEAPQFRVIVSCRFSIAEKDEPAPDGTKRFKFRNPPQPGERVLVVEDVWTEGSTTKPLIKTIEALGAIVSPQVGLVVNRTGVEAAGPYTLVALVRRDMPMWLPHQCPLCAKGSKAVRPKENWDALVG